MIETDILKLLKSCDFIENNEYFEAYIELVNNLHVYDRHMQYIDEILANPEYESPVLKVNPNITNFYDFKPEDFELVGYKSTKLSTKFDVAV